MVALVTILVAAATFAAFSPSLAAGLVDVDDYALLRDNPHYRGLSGEHLRWMFTSRLLGHYQPLAWLSFALDYALAGTDWRQVHFTSVLLHSANAGLLVVLLWRLLTLAMGPLTRWGLAACSAATLFWGAHPLRAESVAWATERRDVLSLFFLLLCTLAYLHAFQPGSPAIRSPRWYAASLVLLLLSLLTKPWGMTFFIAAAVLDWYPLRRWQGGRGGATLRVRTLFLQNLPFAVLGVLFTLNAGIASRSSGAVKALAEWPIPARLAQAAYGLVFYIWKTIAPQDLSALYEMPRTLDPLAPTFLLCYALVAGAAGLAWVWRSRRPWFGAALALYAVTVAPTLGLLQSGEQFVADRYSYVATIPWSALIAAGLALLWRGRLRDGPPPEPAARRRGVEALLVVVALTAYWWLALLQTLVWHDPLTLWEHSAEAYPSPATHVNAGLALEHADDEGQRAQRQEEALAHFRTAVELGPHDGRAWFVLGNALKRTGDRAGAEAALRRAAETMPNAFQAYVNLGTLVQAERPDEALEYFRLAVRDLEHPPPRAPANRPVSGMPYLALGDALRKRGDEAGARGAYERALVYPDAEAKARQKLAEGPAPRP